MIENIKNLYSKIYKKKEFKKELANILDLEEDTVSNMLSGAFKIREEYQEKVVSIAQKTIRNQIQTLEETLK